MFSIGCLESELAIHKWVIVDSTDQTLLKNWLWFNLINSVSSHVHLRVCSGFSHHSLFTYRLLFETKLTSSIMCQGWSSSLLHVCSMWMRSTLCNLLAKDILLPYVKNNNNNNKKKWDSFFLMGEGMNSPLIKVWFQSILKKNAIHR